MNKSELIDKWQKEMDLYYVAKNQAPGLITSTVAECLHETISYFIEDIKNLNGELVKLREVCSLKAAHDGMKGNHHKYCWECGKKL